jgi:hypothetical protein
MPQQNEMFIGYSAAFHEFCHHNLSPMLGTLRVRLPSAALVAVCHGNEKFDSLRFASFAASSTVLAQVGTLGQ